ncbi:DUF6881 domain-containing protein [Actinokineospora spheciospongiae]|uniref:DUF6881 domain-containing protein n=1 Tax=Actinokineospora spheciospongiae TaxID=909613 RepID=UPI000D710317|nr:hypothetical protein [Actinokineospora spheciospongiae]PWW60252.1 hypothetical protein DFQ13_10748 [Actinokineospora spheciospongiae]
MRYVKVHWHHDDEDDPVLYLSELDEDGYETRKVQFYGNGRSEYADADIDTASVGLSEVPFPSIAEISSQPDCAAESMDPEEFERAWARARSTS